MSVPVVVYMTLALMVAEAVPNGQGPASGRTDPPDSTVEVSLVSSSTSTNSPDIISSCLAPPTTPKTFRVRLQKFSVLGTEYTRVLVPAERMTMADVRVGTLSQPTFATCANTARIRQFDAFSFVDNQCKGYNMTGEICSCTTGDFVIYITNVSISSANIQNAVKYLPDSDYQNSTIGLVRKTIYPTVSMTDDRFEPVPDCETILANVDSAVLGHYVDDQCYLTSTMTDYPCDSVEGNATEVMVKASLDFRHHKYFLSMCGKSITPPVFTSSAPGVFRRNLFSHQGYGCVPYPDPVTDEDCVVTILKPEGADGIQYLVQGREYFKTDAAYGSSCEGDELFIYHGPEAPEHLVGGEAAPCMKLAAGGVAEGKVTSDVVTFKFQRRPNHNKGRTDVGFGFTVVGFVF